MKWEGNRQSDNVEDRRDGGSGGGFSGGGLGGLLGGLLGSKLGVGTIVVALLGGWALGINPLTILGMLSGEGGPAPMVQQAPAKRPPADDRMAKFVSTVLADTEDVWTDVFKKGGADYQKPKLVLFRGATSTACGQGQSAMGPFYCPADQKVYIDLGFYETLQKQLGAPGDFAQAYVIAHEVGHHVQNLLGISEKVQQARSRASAAESNALSVRLELQADCLAGVWAHHADNARQLLEKGDVEEAMNAAAKIGDDALQRGSGHAVVPESFTHGSSAQRQRWFDKGLKTGTVKACDTFSKGAI
ncbi:neutral zinc metallopeptidase [Rhodoferax saidenbachensis]|uniref:Metalloprotease n=1 Tax=Rhodoferax saidenbachensis TaxID=1484693 RepID=A0ABU1ZQN7_9BURK|nr:neutral zinc metallopeptidase [Rhodoferax saidenbachensis]MDR7307872.1 putative metalloprotease [Rhodoferax saidenbachensis]